MGGAAERFRWTCGACARELELERRPTWCPSCDRTGTFARTGVALPPRKAPARPFPPLRRVPGGAVGTSSANAVEAVGAPPRAPWAWASEIEPEVVERAVSGFGPWARVTGELARRKLTLVLGRSGIGKTRLLLQLAGGIAATMRRPVVVGALEQAADTARAWLEQLEVSPDRIAITETRELRELAAVAHDVRPVAIVIDPISVATLDGAWCRPGSDAERGAAELLVELADDLDAAIVCNLHMQANGEMPSVGSKFMQHCDARVVLEETSERAVLRLRNDKNRFPGELGPFHDELLDRSAFAFKERKERR